MPDVTVSHHEFPSGVHVELIIDGGNGDVNVHSVEFESVTDGDREVVPKQRIPADHHSTIVGYLENSGYTVRHEAATV